MPKMIQVRNVPDRLHAELVRRARAANQSLTDYVQALLEREVARPPVAELLERIGRREPVELERPASEIIREERTRREAS